MLNEVSILDNFTNQILEESSPLSSLCPFLAHYLPSPYKPLHLFSPSSPRLPLSSPIQTLILASLSISSSHLYLHSHTHSNTHLTRNHLLKAEKSRYRSPEICRQAGTWRIPLLPPPRLTRHTSLVSGPRSQIKRSTNLRFNSPFTLLFSCFYCTESRISPH